MELAERIPEGQKIVSVQELREKGFSQYRVGKLVREGKLIKLNKNFYENTAYRGEDSEFYYIGAYVPKGVICLLSAVVYYNLTTFIPDAIDVAIPRKTKISTVPDWPQINIHYYTDERHELGITYVQEGSNEFRIYNEEKTVVDIVFYRERVGIEETKEILINYLQKKDRNLNKLLQYADMMKSGNILRKYLEVLV